MTVNDRQTGKASTAPITTERLRDTVLDHLLGDLQTFMSDDGTVTDRFVRILDSVNALALKIATESIANRQCLSPMKTHDYLIHADPEAMPGDDALYELRYRIIEQIGNEKPYKDSMLTLDEANEIYGASFVENYWGLLGEHCPNMVATTGDRNLWFSVVRYPAVDQKEQLRTRNEPGQRQS